MQHTVKLGVLSAFLASQAYAAAQQPAESSKNSPVRALEEIVVTSSRVPMPLRQVGTSVTVLDAEDIRARGYHSLFDVLRSQPGIAASNTGGAGKPTSLRIRGEEGYRTRVYLDGIDLSDTAGTQTSPRIEEMLSAGIQRVEILRGPQGLMYGADAGGVINLSTRRAKPGFEGQVSGEGGRYNSRQWSADVAGASERADFAVSATDFTTDGFNARSSDTSLRDADGYDNQTLHGRVGWQALDGLDLELVTHSIDSDSDYDACFTATTFAPSDRCRNRFEQDAWRAAASLVRGDFTHQLAYTGNDTSRQAFTESQPTFGSEGELRKWSYLGQYRASETQRVVFGIEHLNENLDDGSLERERDQESVFLEYQGSLGEQLFFTLGTRRDDNDDFGTHNSHRASAAWVMPASGGEFKLRGAYGTGFRAPSLYEIAYNSGSFAFPPASQASLDAEESDGYDLGAVWAGDNGLYLELVYFDQHISDEIYFDLQGFSGYLQDSGETRSSGVELVASMPLLHGLTLDSNYTYNDTRNAEGSVRVRRPRHLANLGLTWQPLADSLSLALNLRASRDSEGIDGRPLDDYAVADFNARYMLWPGVEIFGRLENLFNRDYQEVPGFNTGGRALYAGARYSF